MNSEIISLYGSLVSRPYTRPLSAPTKYFPLTKKSKPVFTKPAAPQPGGGNCA